MLVEHGKSHTLHSRHLVGADGYGHAVDLWVLGVDGKVDWSTAPYQSLWLVMKAAAMHLGIPIEWGGDWKGQSRGDYDHFQLPREQYP